MKHANLTVWLGLYANPKDRKKYTYTVSKYINFIHDHV